jgi:heme/copper-type cytochrome/quinol oxidase subunit 2
LSSLPIEDEKKRDTRKLVALLLVVVILVVAAVAGVFIYASYRLPQNSGPCSTIPKRPSPNSGNATAGDGPTAKFLIVAADFGSPYAGFNGSYYHLTVQWPVMRVHLGQQVVITVMNCASSEAHGFAITHYLDSGIVLHEGQTSIVNFTANEKGTFRVYCNILCAVHPYMQNGELIVS